MVYNKLDAVEEFAPNSDNGETWFQTSALKDKGIRQLIGEIVHRAEMHRSGQKPANIQ